MFLIPLVLSSLHSSSIWAVISSTFIPPAISLPPPWMITVSGSWLYCNLTLQVTYFSNTSSRVTVGFGSYMRIFPDVASSYVPHYATAKNHYLGVGAFARGFWFSNMHFAFLLHTCSHINARFYICIWQENSWRWRCCCCLLWDFLFLDNWRLLSNGILVWWIDLIRWVCSCCYIC